MPVVQFQPFTSLVQPEFWHELTRRKVDELRLSQDALPIHATYALARTARDRESGADIALPANFALGGDAFGDAPQRDFKHGVVARGSFRNVNTMEEFKSLDKAAVFAAAVDEMWTQALEQDDPGALTRFFVICFADLKKYKYVYWFGFPTFTAKPAWEIDPNGWSAASEVVDRAVCALLSVTPATVCPIQSLLWPTDDYVAVCATYRTYRTWAFPRELESPISCVQMLIFQSETVSAHMAQRHCVFSSLCRLKHPLSSRHDPYLAGARMRGSLASFPNLVAAVRVSC